MMSRATAAPPAFTRTLSAPFLMSPSSSYAGPDDDDNADLGTVVVERDNFNSHRRRHRLQSRGSSSSCRQLVGGTASPPSDMERWQLVHELQMSRFNGQEKRTNFRGTSSDVDDDDEEEEARQQQSTAAKIYTTKTRPAWFVGGGSTRTLVADSDGNKPTSRQQQQQTTTTTRPSLARSMSLISLNTFANGGKRQGDANNSNSAAKRGGVFGLRRRHHRATKKSANVDARQRQESARSLLVQQPSSAAKSKTAAVVAPIAANARFPPRGGNSSIGPDGGGLRRAQTALILTDTKAVTTTNRLVRTTSASPATVAISFEDDESIGSSSAVPVSATERKQHQQYARSSDLRPPSLLRRMSSQFSIQSSSTSTSKTTKKQHPLSSDHRDSVVVVPPPPSKQKRQTSLLVRLFSRRRVNNRDSDGTTDNDDGNCEEEAVAAAPTERTASVSNEDEDEDDVNGYDDEIMASSSSSIDNDDCLYCDDAQHQVTADSSADANEDDRSVSSYYNNADRWSPVLMPVAGGSSAFQHDAPIRPPIRCRDHDAGADNRYVDDKESGDAANPSDESDSDGDESVLSLVSGLIATWVADRDAKLGKKNGGGDGEYAQLKSCLIKNTPLGKRKSVKFDRIHVRYYERTVGDNPSCSSGVPIALGWDVLTSRECAIEDYEQKKPAKRSKRDFYLSPEQRNTLLLHIWNCKHEDIQKARREVTYIQYQRERTSRRPTITAHRKEADSWYEDMNRSSARSNTVSSRQQILQNARQKTRSPDLSDTSQPRRNSKPGDAPPMLPLQSQQSQAFPPRQTAAAVPGHRWTAGPPAIPQRPRPQRFQSAPVLLTTTNRPTRGYGYPSAERQPLLTSTSAMSRFSSDTYAFAPIAVRTDTYL